MLEYNREWSQPLPSELYPTHHSADNSTIDIDILNTNSAVTRTTKQESLNNCKENYYLVL